MVSILYWKSMEKLSQFFRGNSFQKKANAIGRRRTNLNAKILILVSKTLANVTSMYSSTRVLRPVFQQTVSRVCHG